MRFRQFFLKHELDFLAAFNWLSGACSALILVAAIQSSAGYFLAALICYALSAAILTCGLELDRARARELEDDLRTSGRPR